MKFSRLAPDRFEVAGPAVDETPRSLGAAMLHGGVSFGAVSLLAYSIWAFRLVPGTVGLYAATAAVYVGLGYVLHRSQQTPGAKLPVNPRSNPVS
jgi:hypothetical protein